MWALMAWSRQGNDAREARKGSLADTPFSPLWDEDCNANLWDTWGGKDSTEEGAAQDPTSQRLGMSG